MRNSYEPNPAPTYTVAKPNVVVCANARAGWLWHCPEHRAHGTAGDADEAEFLAGSHTYYMRADPYDEEGTGCTTFFWEVRRREG